MKGLNQTITNLSAGQGLRKDDYLEGRCGEQGEASGRDAARQHGTGQP